MVTDDEGHAAWEELHAAIPPGLEGPAGQRHGGQWRWPFETTEKAQIGRRSREWMAAVRTAPTACAR